MSDGERNFDDRDFDEEPETQSILTDAHKAALREKNKSIESLIKHLEQTTAAPRFAVFMFRWENGRLPLEHVIFNWSDGDWPAVVNDIRVRVREIQADTMKKRGLAEPEYRGGTIRRSRTLGPRQAPGGIPPHIPRHIVEKYPFLPSTGHLQKQDTPDDGDNGPRPIGDDETP